MFSVEEMCGTIRTSLYRCTNVQYSLLNWKLSPEKFGFCAARRRVCLSLNQNHGAVSQFSIFLYVKRSVYTMYNIKIMHALGCRQIFLCIVSSKHPNSITAYVQCSPIYKIHGQDYRWMFNRKPPAHIFLGLFCLGFGFVFFSTSFVQIDLFCTVM